MPYQKSKNNNEVTFHVQPEKDVDDKTAASKIGTTIGFLVFAIFIGGLLENIIVSLLLIVGVSYYIFIMFAKKLPTSNNRQPKTFVVSPEFLIFEGKTITRENIQRVRIRNFWKNIDKNNPNHQVNYMVDVESNGTPITIATGLNEPTANAILIDVCNILGLTIS